MKNLKGEKLKGFTLILTLIVLSVIFIFCSALILFINQKNKIVNDYFISLQNNQSMESFIDILITNELYSFENRKKEHNEHLVDSTSFWGLYKVGLLKPSNKEKITHSSESQISFLFGYTPPDYALYIQNNHQPLNLSGNVSFNGEIFISEQGIHPSYLDNVSASITAINKDSIKLSNSALPIIDTNQIRYLLKLLYNREVISEKYTNVQNISTLEDDIVNSFFSPLIIYYSKEHITLSDIKLKGYIMIISDLKVIIKNNTDLKDIWVIAKEIETEKGLNTTIHLLAENILIGNDNHFLYPSSICVINSDTRSLTENYSKLVIQKKSKIEGNILVYDLAKNSTNPIFISEENTEITGSVYCNGLVAVSGKIYGNIICSEVITYTSSGIFNNTLKDIYIDRNKLPEYFISGTIQSGNGWGVAKWLE